MTPGRLALRVLLVVSAGTTSGPLAASDLLHAPQPLRIDMNVQTPASFYYPLGPHL